MRFDIQTTRFRNGKRPEYISCRLSLSRRCDWCVVVWVARPLKASTSYLYRLGYKSTSSLLPKLLQSLTLLLNIESVICYIRRHRHTHLVAYQVVGQIHCLNAFSNFEGIGFRQIRDNKQKRRNVYLCIGS